jgi:hypothetical protein
MASTNEAANSSNQTVSMPPLQSPNISAWFTLLKMQFEIVDITDDKVKFVTLAKCLDSRYLQHIEDVRRSTPATERYETLKGEIIRELADTDGARSRKLPASEDISDMLYEDMKIYGDRRPFQFYQHLRRLALFMLWREQLPEYFDHALAMMEDTDVEKLMRAADRIHETHLRRRRIVAIETERTAKSHSGNVER